MALLSQFGSSNTIIGVQLIGASSVALSNSAIVMQGTAGAPSSGNIASYSQSGSGHSLVIKQ